MVTPKLSSATYDGLLTPVTCVVRELADTWLQVDPITYEFHLRDGVRFHDGTPMTMTVKFMERVLSGKIGGHPRKDAGPVDPWTLSIRRWRFVLSKPWPLLPAMLPFQEIVSEAFVKRVGVDVVS